MSDETPLDKTPSTSVASGDDVSDPTGKRFSFEEILIRLEQRANGMPEALDDVWAADTLGWRSYDGAETHSSAQRRSEMARAEVTQFRKVMPDFQRQSSFFPSESTATIFERSTWTGTAGDTAVCIELCLVYLVNAGRIVRVDMYADAAQFARLHEVLRAAGPAA